MKRKYETPQLGIESFQLNAAVALSCTAQDNTPINHSEDTCTFDNGQFYNYFNCQTDVTGPSHDNHDTTCYHGPLLSGGVIFTYS